MAMFGACKNKTEEENPQDQPTDIVLMNGFNTWDDIILYDMDPTFYKGNWEVNRDSKYISEGDGSWRIYVDSVGANQPSFKIVASGMKTDITDVVEFGLWVYSEADYEFEIIITAFSGDRIVCAPVQKVVNGANDLKFALNRGVVAAQSGKMVTDYSISFAGIKSETVLYVDNFYAKITTDAVVLKPEIQEVITAISALNAQSDRATIEGVIAKYNALTSEDKLCVSNVSNLKAAIQPYYLGDLDKWKKDAPQTLLYFNKPFGEVQVNSVTTGIGAYGYSTEQKHGDDEGSLKVEFTTSSTNWVTLKTTANTLIDEEWIEFYVYNDSEQPKALCVAWNAPTPTKGTTELPFYVLKSKEWTKIYCKSAWLTNSTVGENGTIQICGLVSIDPKSLSYGSGESPEGTMYFSSFIKREFDEETTMQLELQKKIDDARVGDDTNTLYLFDKEVGAEQLTSDANFEFKNSTEVKYENETSSLAIKLNNIANGNDSKIKWKELNYQFNEGDYVVFHVYNDTDATMIELSRGSKHRIRINKGIWTKVIWKAEYVQEVDWSYVYARNLGEQDGKIDWPSTITGTIYFSKAKVYSSNQVVDLSQVADDYEYTVGHTTFVGKPENINGTWCYDPTAFDTSSENKEGQFYQPFYVNGELRWQGQPVKGQVKAPGMGFTFKQTYEIANCYLYITVNDAVQDDIYVQIFNSANVHFATFQFSYNNIELVQTLSNGYKVYKCAVANYFGKTYATNFKKFRLYTRKLKVPASCETIIRDVEVKYEP